MQANAIRCALTLIWPFDFAFSLIRFKERNLRRQPHQSLLCGQSLIVVGVSHEGSGGTKWAWEANAIRCALTLMSELDFAFSLIRLHERNLWRNPHQSFLCEYRLFGNNVSHEGPIGPISGVDSIGGENCLPMVAPTSNSPMVGAIHANFS